MSLTAFALIFALAPPTPADIDGRVRLHLETPVLALQRSRDWFEKGYEHLSANTREESINLPAGAGRFALGFGYGISKGLVVGATVTLSGSRTHSTANVTTPPETTLTSVDVLIRPYLEYAFAPGGAVRPFAFVRGGFGTNRFWVKDALHDSAFQGLSPTLGGGAGLHLFVVPRLSFDLFVAIDHTFVFGRHANGEHYPFRRNSQHTELAANLGISVWLGPVPRSRR